ncbi:hypothetical protein AVEN_82669-1 [Araneus ventricosus]|uniref:Uncharacterized protein n=1 Tax=Araneus ventricosus TaxID=182803 RepID=A0A4Y2P3Z3_ARAVE|nr:hypothetical protein AVEN_82669-1 [Araneus ventricosus]
MHALKASRRHTTRRKKIQTLKIATNPKQNEIPQEMRAEENGGSFNRGLIAATSPHSREPARVFSRPCTQGIRLCCRRWKAAEFS